MKYIAIQDFRFGDNVIKKGTEVNPPIPMSMYGFVMPVRECDCIINGPKAAEKTVIQDIKKVKPPKAGKPLAPEVKPEVKKVKNAKNLGVTGEPELIETKAVKTSDLVPAKSEIPVMKSSEVVVFEKKTKSEEMLETMNKLEDLII